MTFLAAGPASERSRSVWDCAHFLMPCQPTPDRVALGRYQPRAPTDPYVLALEHTVPQIMDSLRACKWNARCAREPAGSAGAGCENEPSPSCGHGCGDIATSASGARLPRGTSIRPLNCP